jgi:hypothetical protein
MNERLVLVSANRVINILLKHKKLLIIKILFLILNKINNLKKILNENIMMHDQSKIFSNEFYHGEARYGVN